MTTLADLTPEQLNECIGMWCDFIPGDGDSGKEPELGIFAYWQWATNEAIITRPDLADTRKWCFPENVTPRFDLPRAWTPQGAPTPGEWETAKTKIIPNENARYDPETNTITGDGIADTKHEPKSAHDIRRFITEWEPAWPKI